MSVAVSFMTVVVALGVTSGFRSSLREGISQITGDIRLGCFGEGSTDVGTPYPFEDGIAGRIRELAEVSSAEPVIVRPGIIKKGDVIQGVMFKGISRDGELDSLGVRLPSDLALRLGVSAGDRLTAYFAGEKVRARVFEVRGTYSGILSGNDNLVVYTSLEDMQTLCGWDSTMASALEVRLKGKFLSPEAIEEASSHIGSLAYEAPPAENGRPLVSTSSVQLYPQIFSWLELIDMNVLLVLGLMIAVAGFNMVSGLLIVLFRNISTIGTLKTLGMSNGSIGKVFLRLSSKVVLKGMVAGNILGIAVCLLQKHTGLLTLDPENYFITVVPITLDWGRILLVDAASYLLIMLILLLPAVFISGVDPARSVRVQ